ncbi:MAG TPA: TonB family protein [Pseudoxanthomonas sp.]
MVRTLPVDSETRPELPRILAIAAAIAVHVFALLLLLIPMATPVLQPVAESKPGIIFLEPKKEIVDEEIVDKKPKPVVPSQTTKPQEETTPTQDPPMIVEGGNVATSNPGVTDPGPVVNPSPVDTGPVTVGALAYVKAPPPPYPRTEIRNGVGGTVLLRVLVDVDGRPLEVVVLESSGNRNLDRSARDNVLKNWLFQPAMRDGQPVQAYGKVPVVFSVQ